MLGTQSEAYIKRAYMLAERGRSLGFDAHRDLEVPLVAFTPPIPQNFNLWYGDTGLVCPGGPSLSKTVRGEFLCIPVHTM